MTIDADAHVIESEESWSYIENEKLRPFLVTPGAGRPQNWLIDGRVFHRGVNFDKHLPIEICEMRDIKGRLKHMDELNIDIQVLYPSLFLRPLTARAEVENAICRSYNQWLIDIVAKGEGRLEWIAVVPFIDPASMVGEVEFAESHGACGIFMRGMIDDKRLSHEYFFPLYAAAEKPACRSACMLRRETSPGCSSSTGKTASCASRRPCYPPPTPSCTTASRNGFRISSSPSSKCAPNGFPTWRSKSPAASTAPTIRWRAI